MVIQQTDALQQVGLESTAFAAKCFGFGSKIVLINAYTIMMLDCPFQIQITGSHMNPNNITHGAPKDEIYLANDLGNIVANIDLCCLAVFSFVFYGLL